MTGQGHATMLAVSPGKLAAFRAGQVIFSSVNPTARTFPTPTTAPR